jgi:hypothetical protein
MEHETKAAVKSLRGLCDTVQELVEKFVRWLKSSRFCVSIYHSHILFLASYVALKRSEHQGTLSLLSAKERRLNNAAQKVWHLMRN